MLLSNIILYDFLLFSAVASPAVGGCEGKGGLWDGSPPTGSTGRAPVGVWGEAVRS